MIDGQLASKQGVFVSYQKKNNIAVIESITTYPLIMVFVFQNPIMHVRNSEEKNNSNILEVIGRTKQNACI